MSLDYIVSYVQPPVDPTRTMIYVSVRFEALHRWVDAPLEQFWLKEFHRHLFYVRVYKTVDHANRSIEFFAFKDELIKCVHKHFSRKKFELSCEQIGQIILKELDADIVEVSEDDENGAVVAKPI